MTQETDLYFYTLTLETPVLDLEFGDFLYNDHTEILETQDPKEIRSYFQKIDPEEIHNYYLTVYLGDPEDSDSEILEFIGGEDYKRDPDLI